MSIMDGWSLVLLAAAAYLALIPLARLMKRRHDALVARLRRDWQEEQNRLAAEERQKLREERERVRLAKQIEDLTDKAA
jgi:hypothetical protein